MNWNKSGNIYCNLGKGDLLFVAYDEKGIVVFETSGVFKTSYGQFDCFHCC